MYLDYVNQFSRHNRADSLSEIRYPPHQITGNRRRQRALYRRYDDQRLNHPEPFWSLNILTLTGSILLTAFIISTYLLINAYHLARGAVSLLMDEELGDDIRTDIIRIVRNTPFAKGIHDLRTRDLGGSYMFEFHLELDGNLSLYDAHDLTDMVEDEIFGSLP